MPNPQIPRIEGEICPQCGKAKFVKNPATGKIFCADKCWLGNQAKSSGGGSQGQPDWQKINGEKNDHIKYLNALKCAALRLNGTQHTDEQYFAMADKIYMREPIKLNDQGQVPDGIPVF